MRRNLVEKFPSGPLCGPFSIPFYQDPARQPISPAPLLSVAGNGCWHSSQGAGRKGSGKGLSCHPPPSPPGKRSARTAGRLLWSLYSSIEPRHLPVLSCCADHGYAHPESAPGDALCSLHFGAAVMTRTPTLPKEVPRGPASDPDDVLPSLRSIINRRPGNLLGGHEQDAGVTVQAGFSGGQNFAVKKSGDPPLPFLGVLVGPVHRTQAAAAAAAWMPAVVRMQ